MPFGKWRGHPLTDVDTGYLLWCLRGCDSLKPWLREAIELELDRRHGEPPPRPQSRPSASLATPALKWEPVVERWFRELALKYHPHRGGSHEAMVALNDAHDRLKA